MPTQCHKPSRDQSHQSPRPQEEQLYLLSVKIFALSPRYPEECDFTLRDGTLDMEIEPEVGTTMGDVIEALVENGVISAQSDEDGKITYRKLVDGFGDSYRFSNEDAPYKHLRMLARIRFYEALHEKLEALDFNRSHADRELFVAFHLERCIDNARRRGILSDDVVLPNTNTITEAIIESVDSYLKKYHSGHERLPLFDASIYDLSEQAVTNVANIAGKRDPNIILANPIRRTQLKSIITSTFIIMHDRPSYKNAQLIQEDQRASTGTTQ